MQEKSVKGISHTARPTAPKPKTATVSLGFGFATFTVAPKPACTKLMHTLKKSRLFC